jgi:hypothetical protein
LLREFAIPEELLGGSLSSTHRRCGKAACHCVSGAGHPMWTLTYSVAGEKRVQVIPAGSIAEIEPLIVRSRRYREAVAEVAAINAQLVSMWREQRRTRR